MMHSAMPPRSRLKLPPLNLGPESFGQRLARIRKERGFTQIELAQKIGTIQVLVSNYECDRLRMNAEMVVRFARALGVSADVVLGLKAERHNASGRKVPRRLQRRVEQIARLPTADQRALLMAVSRQSVQWSARCGLFVGVWSAVRIGA
jgi:transcriptional regulator with XRE-family HTH domain